MTKTALAGFEPGDFYSYIRVHICSGITELCWNKVDKSLRLAILSPYRAVESAENIWTLASLFQWTFMALKDTRLFSFKS